MRTFNMSKMSEQERRAVLRRSEADLAAITYKAREIVDQVRLGGDAALLRIAESIDGPLGRPMRISLSELKKAADRLLPDLMKSMETCKRRIERFHSRQTIRSFRFKDSCGLLGQSVVPLARVGVYAPGGTASYPSSVIMACVPARIAGVRELVLCTPAKLGRVNDAVLAAAHLCEVDEVFAVGGAQAIAALAYGTESIRKVRKIVGPGGAFVSAAKLLVRNDCEIDFLAGPSEVLVIADGAASPRLVAADMLAQLEHDPLARAVLLTNSGKLLAEARDELQKMIVATERREIAAAAAVDGAVFIKTKSISEALDFSNEYAPEHLLVDTAAPLDLLPMIENAGSVFLGRYSSVSFGDYCSGTNHILPTMGMASMKSSLSVYDFLRVVPYQCLSSSGADKLAGVVEKMARAEGLPAHAQAALMRSKKVNI